MRIGAGATAWVLVREERVPFGFPLVVLAESVSADSACHGIGDVRWCRHGRSSTADWYRTAPLNVLRSKRELDDSTSCGRGEAYGVSPL